MKPHRIKDVGRTLLANRLGAAANRISYWVGSLYKLRGQPGNVMQLFIYLFFLLLWCGKKSHLLFNYSEEQQRTERNYLLLVYFLERKERSTIFWTR